jgi:hypothetical protein
MQAGGVVRYVLKLGEEVGQVANAMLVITGCQISPGDCSRTEKE